MSGICDRCSAPMCPENHPENKIWYAKEEICRKKEYASLRWIKQQKKIKKKDRGTGTYYTYNMLNRNCIIRGGIKGLNPDRDEDEERWIKKHPEINPDRFVTEHLRKFQVSRRGKRGHAKEK